MPHNTSENEVRMRIAAIFLAVVLSACPAVAEDVPSPDGHILVRSEYGHLSDGMKADLAARSARELKSLEAYFGTTAQRPIIVDLADRYPFSIAYRHLNLIGFPRHIIERDMAVTAHEITHLLLPRGHSAALREGIAIYAQDRFGEVTGFPNFGSDVHAEAALRLTRAGGQLSSFKDAEAYLRRPGAVNQRVRRDAYFIAGSFTRFLLEDLFDGNVQAFLPLYEDGDYQRHTGRPLDDIERVWRARITE